MSTGRQSVIVLVLCMQAAGLCLYWPPCLGYGRMILVVDANERRDGKQSRNDIISC